MSRTACIVGLTALLGFTAFAVRGSASDWSRFRGPNGSGVGDASGLPVELGPEKGVVWKTAIPPGHSSPVLSGNHVYLTGLDGDVLVTLALARESGRVLWRREVLRPRALRVDKRNHPAAPSPAADGGGVYVFFQDVGLIAYDTGGAERWRLALGPFDNAYGMGASPIVADGLVIQVCDQSNGSYIVAVGKGDGRVRWRAERPEARSGHSTPVVYRPARGPAQLLVPGSFFLTAYALASGEKLWWASGLAFEMKATPVLGDDVVFIHGTSSASFSDDYDRKVPSFEDLRAAHDKDGDGRFSPDEIPDTLARKWRALIDLDHDGYLSASEWAYYQAARASQGGMWAFRLGGKGDVTEANVRWHYDRSVPQLPSPLLYAGVLFMLGDTGILTALDPKTGQALKQARLPADNYFASPVAAGGRLLVVSESGKAIVLKADASLAILATNDLEDVAYATPALAGGRLYLRTRGTLYCFGSNASSRVAR